MKQKIACLTSIWSPITATRKAISACWKTQEYFERYTEIINRYTAKVTMFTVTSLFERFGEHFERLARHPA
jgi:hypothetical protein